MGGTLKILFHVVTEDVMTLESGSGNSRFGTQRVLLFEYTFLSHRLANLPASLLAVLAILTEVITSSSKEDPNRISTSLLRDVSKTTTKAK